MTNIAPASIYRLVVLPLLFLSLFIVSLHSGEVLAHHVGGAGYDSKGHLTSDGNINWCHTGAYAPDGQYAAGTWSAVTPNKLNIYSTCSGVETRTLSINLGVSTPLGYAVICPPVPHPCFNAATGEGENTNFDTVWIYSEGVLNSYQFAMGAGVTTDERRHLFLHEMGHSLTDLAHRYEEAAVMRQGRLSNIMPLPREIQLMEAKY